MKWADFHQRNAQYQSSPLLIALCLFSASVLYCSIAERTLLFERIAKSSEPRLFLLCVGISVLLTLGSWTRIEKPAPPKSITGSFNYHFLHRNQTEEFKGWWQAVILLYHYFGLSNNLPVYQVARVLVAGYIFLTGYSHTSYFLKTNDFSLDRTVQTLLRLNLLSCTLAYALNRHWEFYYFPGLTSFWYLVLFATLRLARTPSKNLNLCRVSINLVISCIAVQLLLYSETGVAIWNALLSFVARVGGPQINARELIFRLKLDSLMPFWGAFLAIIAVKVDTNGAAWFEHDLRISPSLQRLLSVHSPWIALSLITPYFLAIQQFENKVISNAWHPFTSIIPIAAMLALRNGTSRQRQGYNHVFRWLGSISLELYVLQSHVWLTRNNKELLHLSILGRVSAATNSITSTWCSWLDKLILTSAFLITSHYTAHATKPLVMWLSAGSKKGLIAVLFACWMLNLHWKKLTI